MSTRTCNDCGEAKELDLLVKAQDCLHGRRKLCKACSVLRVQKNVCPTKKATYDAVRRSENLEQMRAYDKERSKLPHRRAAHNEHTRRRRANLVEATPVDFDKEAVVAMYLLAHKLNRITGSTLQVDHIKPLAKGGAHDIANLQLLDAKLNNAKGSKEDYQLSWKTYPR